MRRQTPFGLPVVHFLKSLEPRLLHDQAPTADLFNASAAPFARNQGQWANAPVRYAFQGGRAGVALTISILRWQSARGPPGPRHGPSCARR